MTTREARTSTLRAAATRKSEDAQARARRALLALANRGEPINFRSVAEEGNVSKGFLYGHPELRRQITERRRQPPPRIEPNQRAPASKEASAVVKLAVAADVIRQLRAENEQLRTENATLRGDLLAADQTRRLRDRAANQDPQPS